MDHTLILSNRKAIILWLMICAALVAGMVVLGGYTRLSGSGLSITSWKPIHGTLPPLNETQWQDEFDAYKASPQYIKVNKDMSLEAFKDIFWPEFLHRLLGRLVGVVFFIPLFYFFTKKAITRKFFWRLLGIFALGGLQGLIGWLMVQSGLVDDPQVSPLRLALHLSLAFLILGLLLWSLADIISNGHPERSRGIQAQPQDPSTALGMTAVLYIGWFALLCLQIIIGAFMAGLHGGLIFNTWPKMNGKWFPDELRYSFNWYGNLILIQFIHRTLAILVAVCFGLWWYLCRTYVIGRNTIKICASIAVLLLLQFTLGVLTLIKQVPLNLAWAHQTTGLVLFSVAVILLHRTLKGNVGQ